MLQQTFPQPCRSSQSDMLPIAKYDCSGTVTISPESISNFTLRVIEDLTTFLERHNMSEQACVCVCGGGGGIWKWRD